jgi:hypothetical protein
MGTVNPRGHRRRPSANQDRRIPGNALQQAFLPIRIVAALVVFGMRIRTLGEKLA